MRIATLFLALSVATPVGAVCPVAADLDKGIEVMFGDGSDDSFAMIYSRRDDGGISEAEKGDGGEVFITGPDGLLAVEYYPDGIDESKPDLTVYDFELSLPLVPWTSFVGTQTTTEDTGETTRESVKLNVLGNATLVIGDCSYEVIETETFIYFDDGYINHLRQDFIQDLGFGIIRGFGEVGAPNADTTYVLESIKVVE